MARVTNHDDLAELLGAYALDAVDPDEGELLERHLEGCPRCRAELVEHREVAGLLGFAGQEAPADLWDRIAAAMQEPPPALRLQRMDLPSLDETGSLDSPTTPLTPGSTRGTGSDGADPPARLFGGRFNAAAPSAGTTRRRSRPSPRADRPYRHLPVRAMSLAAAAAVVVAVLGVQVYRLDRKTGQMNREITAAALTPGASMTAVHQALGTAGVRKVVLTSLNGGETSLDAVILPNDQGYVYNSRLTPLNAGETYQLWGIEGANRVSFGTLGSAPESVEAFRAAPDVKALAVTAEVAGGVALSSHAPVAIGSLPPV